jgi:hypothetical protein
MLKYEFDVKAIDVGLPNDSDIEQEVLSVSIMMKKYRENHGKGRMLLAGPGKSWSVNVGDLCVRCKNRREARWLMYCVKRDPSILEVISVL